MLSCFICSFIFICRYEKLNSSLGIVPKQIIGQMHKYACPWLLLSALLIMAKDGEQFESPSIENWLNKLWDISMISSNLFSALIHLKKNEKHALLSVAEPQLCFLVLGRCAEWNPPSSQAFLPPPQALSPSTLKNLGCEQ